MAEKVLENDLMFFYGSLQRGEYPYKQLNLQAMLEFVGDVTFKGELRDMDQYPACKLGENNVHGELFKVIDLQVAGILDKFERFDESNNAESLYIRQKITLNESGLQAWTYIYNQDFSDRPVIESGDWLAYKKAANRADFKGFED
jgi:gamma-glutamylcyclotransferase (GGCT)/AIG2-like uncharacterized protein YtfP